MGLKQETEKALIATPGGEARVQPERASPSTYNSHRTRRRHQGFHSCLPEHVGGPQLSHGCTPSRRSPPWTRTGSSPGPHGSSAERLRRCNLCINTSGRSEQTRPQEPQKRTSNGKGQEAELLRWPQPGMRREGPWQGPSPGPAGPVWMRGDPDA